MSYQEKVAARTRKAGNTVCVGMDPILKKIPGSGSPEEKIKRFYSEMLEAMLARNVLPAAVKPNIAYYEAVSLSCLQVLQNLIAAFRAAGVLVVLDAKRGDISSTSGAYAQMAFNVFGADSVTAAPYMGLDTIKPFQDVAQDGQGIYILVRTSNPSAKDFQDLTVDGVPLYRKVAEKLADWNDGSLGAVVGATAPRELRDLLAYWKGRGREVPVLIPGIAIAGVSGGQTGSVADVYQAIKDAQSDPWLHLINSSSGINYAYEKFPALKPAQASVAALEELIAEIGAKL
jgi:orotidine-5'-phosphate decarboxylase